MGAKAAGSFRGSRATGCSIARQRLLASATGGQCAGLDPAEGERFVTAQHAGHDHPVGPQGRAFSMYCVNSRPAAPLGPLTKSGERSDVCDERGIAVIGRELPANGLIERRDARIGRAANPPYGARSEPALDRIEL